MNNRDLIQKLNQQLRLLEQEVLQHDAHLPPGQQKMLADVERFNDALFMQTGGKLAPCIGQLKNNIIQLEKLLKTQGSHELVTESCQRIQDRFTALRRALGTTSLDVKSLQQQKRSRRSAAIKRDARQHDQSGFNWIAANVMQNSHQLYEELNKHLNWAARIEQKIADSQAKLALCPAAEKIKYQNEVLAMHQRLGKCRQAITYIENRIQIFENPFKKQR